MQKNYHTHTFRCNHASMEDERAYIESAIAGGLKVLGFADHVPMPPYPDVEYQSLGSPITCPSHERATRSRCRAHIRCSTW